MSELYAWLDTHGIEPTGASFLKFNVIEMARELEVEAAVPVAVRVATDGDVICGILPTGTYVSATHIGHEDELISATAEVLAWAEERALSWDVTETPAGRRWGCRLLVNKTVHGPERDADERETEILFRLAD